MLEDYLIGQEQDSAALIFLWYFSREIFLEKITHMQIKFETSVEFNWNTCTRDDIIIIYHFFNIIYISAAPGLQILVLKKKTQISTFYIDLRNIQF